MPFTTKEARRITDSAGPQTVGDRCFLAYREMLRRWRKSTRWTTAHEIYREMDDIGYVSGDEQIAIRLAWQVFFQLHVMPYEIRQRIVNGEVETE